MGKERFLWYEVFYFTAAPLLIIGALKGKNPQAVAPLFPLSFAYGYQYHMFRGDKQAWIRREAERLIREEPERFYLPEGNLLASREEYEEIMQIKRDGKT